jgi:NTE family protein
MKVQSDIPFAFIKSAIQITATRSLLLVCLLSADSSGHSQDVPKHDKTERPKLGLVLEGGGALGLAHIGVITWLEEHRIPVSYVAGTSMGGLVGGIYATGRSPAEVRDLVNGIDWDQVMSGTTPFRDLSFRRKQDAHEVPGSLEFGLRGGLQFPAGFNTGQEVDLILDHVLHFLTPISRALTICRFRSPVSRRTLSPVSLMSSTTVPWL